MKKRLLLVSALVLMLGFLTGCQKDDVKLDLAKVEENVQVLKGNSFDRLSAVDVINAKVENLEEVLSYDFKKTFNFTLAEELMEEYSVGYNKKAKASYFIVKPVDGKKEDVKKAIDNYYSKAKITDYSFEEESDFLIYLSFEGSKDLMKDVKAAKANVFGSLLKLDKDLLKSQLDIDEADLDEYLVMLPQFMTSSSSYIIVKPASGKTKAVKEKIDSYMASQEETWKTYLQDQYELVKNRKFEEYGDYLIYIISTDNDLVLKTIKG